MKENLKCRKKCNSQLLFLNTCEYTHSVCNGIIIIKLMIFFTRKLEKIKHSILTSYSTMIVFETDAPERETHRICEGIALRSDKGTGDKQILHRCVNGRLA